MFDEFPFLTANTVLIVPAGTLAAYRAAPVWQEFNIVEDATAIPIISSKPNVFNIFPNPVSDSFRIGGITENSELTISDLSGRIVLKRTIAPDETISVRHLPRGVYIVALDSSFVKLLKE